MGNTSANGDRRRFWLLMIPLLVFGLAVRLGLALASYGSRDAISWSIFANMVHVNGFFETWRIEPQMNHPPLPVAYAAAAWKLVGADVSARWQFCVLLKLPGILADLGSGVLLGLIGQRRMLRNDDSRHGTNMGLALAASYLASPLAILISAYHGNTDCVLVFFCLLAFDCIDRGRFGWAGLALGAAVNVKLAPLILILPALSLCRTRQDAGRFIAALSAGAIPFIPLLVLAGHAFASNAIGYDLVEARWGLMYPAMVIEGHDVQGMKRVGLVAAYIAIGKTLIWLASIALAVWQWRSKRFNAFDIGAITFALVLILAPGFGIQYLVWPLALMIAASPTRAVTYNAAASVFATATYYWFLDPNRRPLFSMFNDLMPHEVAIVGVFAWVSLIVFIARRIRVPGDVMPRSLPNPVPDAQLPPEQGLPARE